MTKQLVFHLGYTIANDSVFSFNYDNIIKIKEDNEILLLNKLNNKKVNYFEETSKIRKKQSKIKNSLKSKNIIRNNDIKIKNNNYDDKVIKNNDININTNNDFVSIFKNIDTKSKSYDNDYATIKNNDTNISENDVRFIIDKNNDININTNLLNGKINITNKKDIRNYKNIKNNRINIISENKIYFSQEEIFKKIKTIKDNKITDKNIYSTLKVNFNKEIQIDKIWENLNKIINQKKCFYNINLDNIINLDKLMNKKSDYIDTNSFSVKDSHKTDDLSLSFENIKKEHRKIDNKNLFNKINKDDYKIKTLKNNLIKRETSYLGGDFYKESNNIYIEMIKDRRVQLVDIFCNKVDHNKKTLKNINNIEVLKVSKDFKKLYKFEQNKLLYKFDNTKRVSSNNSQLYKLNKIIKNSQIKNTNMENLLKIYKNTRYLSKNNQYLLNIDNSKNLNREIILNKNELLDKFNKYDNQINIYQPSLLKKKEKNIEVNADLENEVHNLMCKKDINLKIKENSQEIIKKGSRVDNIKIKSDDLSIFTQKKHLKNIEFDKKNNVFKFKKNNHKTIKTDKVIKPLELYKSLWFLKGDIDVDFRILHNEDYNYPADINVFVETPNFKYYFEYEELQEYYKSGKYQIEFYNYEYTKKLVLSINNISVGTYKNEFCELEIQEDETPSLNKIFRFIIKTNKDNLKYIIIRQPTDIVQKTIYSVCRTYLCEEGHPIPFGNDLGRVEIPVPINIMVDFINILLLIWKKRFYAFGMKVGVQAIIGFLNIIYEWLTLETSQQEESIEYYYRCFQWLRWEAEKVINVAKEDPRANGNKWLNFLINEMIDYMNDHHYDFMPILKDIYNTDDWRNQGFSDVNLDIFSMLDKFKGERNYICKDLTYKLSQKTKE